MSPPIFAYKFTCQRCRAVLAFPTFFICSWRFPGVTAMADPFTLLQNPSSLVKEHPGVKIYGYLNLGHGNSLLTLSNIL